MQAIADQGSEIKLGQLTRYSIQAYDLHSSGNVRLFDPLAKILFSGDLRAALLPGDHSNLLVTNFTAHVRFAEGFHRRWMGCNSAKRDG